MKLQHNWARRLTMITVMLLICAMLITSCSLGGDKLDNPSGSLAETSKATAAPDDTVTDPNHTQDISLLPGLYDANDNMLASWEELVNTYGMDVEKNYDRSTSQTDTASPYYVLTNHTALTNSVKLIIGNIEQIGSYAFFECTSLESITIPGSVMSIGNNAFNGCSSLASITIPNSVTSISYSTFEVCTDLTSITIPDSITNIGTYAFLGCDSLTSINIPNSVTTIEKFAFASCSNLDSITVDENNSQYRGENNCLIERDTNTLILGCKNSIIPSGVTSIGDSAFSYCVGLTNITIPNSVTNIGNHAFVHCCNLTSITIPDSVKTIGSDAFLYCRKLVEVYNLSSLKITAGSDNYGSAGYNALNIHTDANAPSKLWSTDDGFIFYEDGNTCYLITYAGTDTAITLPKNCNGKNYEIYKNAFYTVFYINNNLTSVTIPDSVTSIGNNAFLNCTSLTNITIPNNVTNIGAGAFDNCSSLTNITIPESITSIGSYAFRSCTNLTSVTIPDIVTHIYNGAFQYCHGLTNIVIPESITRIDSEAFGACINLTSITFEGTIAKWNAITFGSYWNTLVPATEVICNDGVVKLK